MWGNMDCQVPFLLQCLMLGYLLQIFINDDQKHLKIQFPFSFPGMFYWVLNGPIGFSYFAVFLMFPWMSSN